MKTIHTGRASFLTGAEIADAVTAYALALARAHDLDVVDVPFLADDGSLCRAQFRIGWLIDTVAIDDGQPTDELIEVDTIFDLLAKSRALTSSRSQFQFHLATDASDGTDWDEII